MARDMAQLAYEQYTSEGGYFHQPNPAAVVLFGAQAPFVDSVDKITQVANQLKSWANLITVNYNVNSADLTNFLNSIATPYMNLSVSKTLYDDLEFNLMQTNCFCDFGPQLSAFDPVKNRVVKYADCSISSEEIGASWNSDETFCNIIQSNIVLVPLTSSLRYNFTVSIYQNNLPGFILDPIYIGLHRNSRKAWVWYDYDGSEIPDSGSFSNWAPGYGINSTGDCVAIQGGNAEKSSSYLWKNVACNINISNITDARCGYRACDAANMYQSALAGLNQRCTMFKSDVEKKKAFEARRKFLKETRKNKNKA
uniref:C-type lectin domain-containing protein n=1 Tax=Acrobeloides nanus TaxID=290746 RepID=A0A914DXJ8_9BILA